MQKTDMIGYIEDVKNPSKLLEYCKKFHELEPRDIAYVVSNHIISKDPDSTSFVLVGAKLIIITWNAARFQRLRREIKPKLESDILEAHSKTMQKLEQLKAKRLEELNLDDPQLKELIGSVYQEFSSKESVGYTGASKILHLLNPRVFMMWDGNIREAYHKLHSKHKKKGAECYLEFLKQCQEIVKAVLSVKSEDDLWREHLAFLDGDFTSAFSFKESVLKMLDECNYVRFTNKTTL